MKLEIELLPRDFGCAHSVGRVADLICREVPRSFGQMAGNHVFEMRQTISRLCADHEDFGKVEHFGQSIGVYEELVLGGNIDLVQNQHLGLWSVLQPFDNPFHLGAKACFGINDQKDNIGILCATPSRLNHGAVKAAVRFKNTRRIDQHHLCIAVQCNPHQARTRGLSLGTNNRDFLADERIYKR